MKPGWDDAPKWARWLAMDADGEWHWFAMNPKQKHGAWWSPVGRYERAGMTLHKPEKEKRP